MKSLTCPLCQNAFETRNPLRKYCSEPCSAAARVQRIKSMDALVSIALSKAKKSKKCAQCSREFSGTGTQKYCSTVCAANAFEINRKNRLAAIRSVRCSGLTDRRCAECRDLFSPRLKTQRFCSGECSKFYARQQKMARELEWEIE